ncbi:hypothetical protein [Actinoplanes subglobosus]|uniref:Ricin B lectin domain-containing protein n=1 Tax=Actinoplanes subglobosus TaxID=1547892 RepID=A0ABV8IUE3_9ACTN
MSAVTRIAVVAGGCALVAGLAACASTQKTDTPAAAPTATATTAASAAGSAPAPAASATPTTTTTTGTASATIRGEREFAFVDSAGKTLTVGADGIAAATAKPGDRSLFVTTPLAPGSTSYLMQTARMIEGGEPWCLQVHKPGGTSPLQLKIAACDAGEKDQVFTFPKATGGKGLYIEVNGLYALTDTSDGKVVVQESGEGDAMSTFTVQDKGKSTLPHLGD